jgi:hypothetical protein
MKIERNEIFTAFNISIGEKFMQKCFSAINTLSSVTSERNKRSTRSVRVDLDRHVSIAYGRHVFRSKSYKSLICFLWRFFIIFSLLKNRLGNVGYIIQSINYLTVSCCCCSEPCTGKATHEHVTRTNTLSNS